MGKDVSIVVPVFNEQGNIPLLTNKIIENLSNYKLSFEILFIDDGSTDKTYSQILEESKRHKNVKYIKFLTNHGKASALTSGFHHAKGDIIITMDGDLQDDPKELIRFINQINSGYDLVTGWKKRRKDSLAKTLPSKVFNALTSKVTGLKLHDYNCGFKAYKSALAKSINLHGDLHRYIPAIAHSRGFKVKEIPVKHHKRKFGVSKYGTMRLFRGFFDLFTIKYLISYSRRPLHFFGGAGLIFSSIGFIIGIYLTYLDRIKQESIIRPLLFLAMLLILVGVQTFSTGLIAEMLADSKKEIDNILVQESNV